MRAAIPGMAEEGSKGLTLLEAAVPGMNWAIPSAPALLTTEGCQPDSWFICADRRENGTPYLAEAEVTRLWY
jgi:hypothetical protein